jgi:hypothetical protein
MVNALARAFRWRKMLDLGAFGTLEEKVTELMALNQQLVLENSAMAQAIHEFENHTGARVEFSAGAEGGYEATVHAPGQGLGAARTEFEARVIHLETTGKAKTDAIMLAMQESPARYQRHLEEIGAIARNL